MRWRFLRRGELEEKVMAAREAIKNHYETVEEGPVETLSFSGAAMPVTFSGTVGLFTPAVKPTAPVAVLFLSPWGFEEMCTRKFWRILAEDLSAAGIASLRFDYAGTGDALDVSDDKGLSIWSETALAAAATLKSLSGCERVILVSQGLGSAIALDIAERLHAVEGIAFLAPTISGRFYLRELSVWSKMIDESMGLSEGQREQSDGIWVAGLKMPEQIAADIRKLNLASLSKFPAPAGLVLTRPGRPNDAEFATRLKDLGGRIEQGVYDGYDELVSNPTIATMPLDAGQRVANWVRLVAAALPAKTSRKATRPARAEPLVGDDFRETPLRLGDGDRMFGILCEPTGVRTGATAILLTTAYDRNAGWGRTTVAMARNLARSGIPSLRFDTANVADSPPQPGAPEQVLYSEAQYRDVADAFNLIEARKLLPAFVVGRCSGGYLGFQAAVHDQRCSGLITVNPYAFHWDQNNSVDEALRFVPRSLETYGQKFLQVETLKRLLNGSVDTGSAMRNILTSLLRRIAQLRQPLLDRFSFLSREHATVLKGFNVLKNRGVEVSLIYSAQDIGLEHFSLHFGRSGQGLQKFGNARLTVIPDADHNLTPAPARAIYVREIQTMALRLGARRGSAQAATGTAAQVKSQKYVGYQAP
jgi:pimeloyl-ACP methyl ester carboxylesterase